MAEKKDILLEKKKGVGWITIDNPPVNVFTIKSMWEMHHALEDCKADPEVKVVVITSAGDRAFSAGVSVQEHGPDAFQKTAEALFAMEDSARNLDKPCVAAVNGYCLGGALELVMCCDLAIASEKATFAQPEIKVGQMAGTAVVSMPPIIGRARTMELLLTGDTISAQQAEQWGLINKVVPRENFRQEVEKFVARLTANSGIVLALTRQAIASAYGKDPAEAQPQAMAIYDKLAKTEDYQEGIKAFSEKRPPQWKNR